MLADKWTSILAGERVVMSDGEYDQLIDWINSHDEKSDTYVIGGYLASLPNPRQMGTKDTLVAFVPDWVPTSGQPGECEEQSDYCVVFIG